jgi:repressor LexA
MSDVEHLSALRTYWKQHQAFPAMAKVCEVVGLSSTSSVFAMFRRLTDAGYLQRVDRRIVPTKKFFARPVIGSVRAGVPQPESQEAVELMSIDDYLVDDPNRTVLSKVRGDSMTGVGLLDGDVVVVERNAPTRPGDIVAAVVDGEMTLKVLRFDRKRNFYLEPANPVYDTIFPKNNLELVGLVVGMFRRMQR